MLSDVAQPDKNRRVKMHYEFQPCRELGKVGHATNSRTTSPATAATVAAAAAAAAVVRRC